VTRDPALPGPNGSTTHNDRLSVPKRKALAAIYRAGGTFSDVHVIRDPQPGIACCLAALRTPSRYSRCDLLPHPTEGATTVCRCQEGTRRPLARGNFCRICGRWQLVGHHCIHQHASCMVVVISAVGLTFTWTLYVGGVHENMSAFSFNSHPSAEAGWHKHPDTAWDLKGIPHDVLRIGGGRYTERH
jgi:hypothetical protein